MRVAVTLAAGLCLPMLSACQEAPGEQPSPASEAPEARTGAFIAAGELLTNPTFDDGWVGWGNVSGRVAGAPHGCQTVMVGPAQSRTGQAGLDVRHIPEYAHLPCKFGIEQYTNALPGVHTMTAEVISLSGRPLALEMRTNCDFGLDCVTGAREAVDGVSGTTSATFELGHGTRLAIVQLGGVLQPGESAFVEGLSLQAVGPLPFVNTNVDFSRGFDHWYLQDGSWNTIQRHAPFLHTGQAASGESFVLIDRARHDVQVIQAPETGPGRYRVTARVACRSTLPKLIGVRMEQQRLRDGRWLSDPLMTMDSGRLPSMQPPACVGLDPQHVIEASFEVEIYERVRPSLLRVSAGVVPAFTGLPAQGTTGQVAVYGLQLERLRDDREWHPPVIARAETEIGDSGALTVSWNLDDMPVQATRVDVLVTPGASVAGGIPRASVPFVLRRGAMETSLRVGSLENGVPHAVALVVLDDTGRRLVSPSVIATPRDRAAPPAGSLAAETSRRDHVRVQWWPHPLDGETKLVELFGADPGGALHPLGIYPVDLGGRPQTRPTFRTAATLEVELPAPPHIVEIVAEAVDPAGNAAGILRTPIEAERVQVPGPFSVETGPPTHQSGRQFPSAFPATSLNPADVVAMPGESRGFQVAIKNWGSLRKLRVTPSELVDASSGAAIEAPWVSWHFIDHVGLAKNSMFFDDAVCASLPPNHAYCANRQFERLWLAADDDFPDELSEDVARDVPGPAFTVAFIRVEVPADARPGSYRGTLRFEAQEGFHTVPFSVEVSPIALPRHGPVHAGQWMRWDRLCEHFQVGLDSEACWFGLDELSRLFTNARHDFMKVPWSLITSWEDTQGQVHHDFTRFDRFIDSALRANPRALLAIEHQGGRAYGYWEATQMAVQSHYIQALDRHTARWIDAPTLLTDIEQHLDARGLLSQSMVYVADEPTNISGPIQSQVQSYHDLSARVRAAAPRLRRVDAIHTRDLVGHLDVWTPLLDDLMNHYAVFASAQNQGHELWMYTAWTPQGVYPNRLIDSHVIKSRVLHWYSALLGTTGYLHWGFNWWGIAPEGLPGLESAGDAFIVWPSQRHLVNSSLRFEQQREGLQDWTLLAMLRQVLEDTWGLSPAQSLEYIRERAAGVVNLPMSIFYGGTSGIDYTRDWETLETLRRHALETLEGL